MKFLRTIPLLGQTRILEQKIDQFLDKISEAGVLFSRAVRIYMREGSNEEFESLLSQVNLTEASADRLRREIEGELYEKTLIPDLRGDVLQLLEEVDTLANIVQADLFRFSIQKPNIPESSRQGFIDIAEVAIQAVESVVMAARSFFRDLKGVRDHVSKVLFLESEADKINARVQRDIFLSDLALDHKMQLLYFIERIDELANHAEDVADKLSIYAIKRQI